MFGLNSRMKMTDMFDLTIQSFAGTLILSLVVFLFVVGIFTTYFGNGPTRKGGIFMIVFSLAILAVYYVLLRLMVNGFSIVDSILVPGLFFLLAMVIGVAIGLVIFLAILIKS